MQTKRFCCNTLQETQNVSLDCVTAGRPPQRPITIKIVTRFTARVLSSDRSPYYQSLVLQRSTWSHPIMHPSVPVNA